MKQRIIAISNIKFEGADDLRVLKDASDTFAYDYFSERLILSNRDLLKLSHTSYVYAMLFNYCEQSYDVSEVDKGSIVYTHAADTIASYVRTDFLVDDADKNNQLHDDRYYKIDIPRTMYMYYDEHLQAAIECFNTQQKADAILQQAIFEYMFRYMHIDVYY